VEAQQPEVAELASAEAALAAQLQGMHDALGASSDLSKLGDLKVRFHTV